jgi:hypothetical protein
VPEQAPAGAPRQPSKLVTLGRAGAAYHRKITDNSGKRRSVDRAGQQPFPSVLPARPITRIVSRTEEVRGSNPLTSTPNLAGQSVVGVKLAALTACCGRGAAASARHSPAREARSDQAADLATARPPPTTTARSKPTPPLASTACASLDRQVPTRADDEAVVDTAGDHADPGYPSHAAACPPPTSTTPRRTQRTRERMDTGRPHWTPDAWTLRCPHRTLDSGRVDGHAWPLDARTGHRTPDAGRGRGHGDKGTAGIRTSWATTSSGRAVGRPTVFLWTAPR